MCFSHTGYSCPSGWQLNFLNQCYKLYSNVVKTYTEAKDSCITNGGMLPEPRNERENNLVHKMAGSNNVWLGITYSSSEGVWLFDSDNTEAQYSKWANGAPKNDNARNCVCIVREAWYDVECDANPCDDVVLCVRDPDHLTTAVITTTETLGND